MATEVAGVDAETRFDAEDVVVAVLDDDELLARRIAASFASSLRSAAFTNGERDGDDAASDEAVLLGDAG